MFFCLHCNSHSGSVTVSRKGGRDFLYVYSSTFSKRKARKDGLPYTIGNMLKQLALHAHLCFHDVCKNGIVQGVIDIIGMAGGVYGVFYTDVDNIVVANVVFQFIHTMIGMKTQILKINDTHYQPERLVEMENLFDWYCDR